MTPWDDYVLAHGNEFACFWEQQLKSRSRNLLFVIGLGFDPRMCTALRSLLQAGGDGRRDCIALEYDEGDRSSSQQYKSLAEANREELRHLVERDGRGALRVHALQVWSGDGRRIASRSAAQVIQSAADVAGYDDIIVDISAMPRGIYFALIHKLLLLLGAGAVASTAPRAPNLHVVVSEHSVLDARIVEDGIDDRAAYLHGFETVDREATEGMPRVWIPVLGEGQENQLRRMRDLVRPDQVCPLLPFPSVDPRRGDDLIGEYQRFLFDDLQVQPRDILYAHEQNPFQACRTIHGAVVRYARVFRVLRGCKAFLSANSSKLLSLGVLLAAHELKRTGYHVGIAHVDSLGYRMMEVAEEAAAGAKGEPFELWLTGECYA